MPADVLLKSGRPTADEWVTLKGHPEAGIALAGAIRDWLGPWTGAINEHHERYDGQGYPRGLTGTEISLAGRIVAVPDAFETMTASRSYKTPMSMTAARRELTDCAGAHFEPDVVRAFTEISLPRLCRRTLGAGIFVNLPILGPLQTVGAQLAGSAAPLGSGVASLAAGAPASAAAMTVLASSVAIGVVPASAAAGAPARPAPVSVAHHAHVPMADVGRLTAPRPFAQAPAGTGSHPSSVPVATTRPAPVTAGAARPAPVVDTSMKAAPTMATAPRPAPTTTAAPKPVKATPPAKKAPPKPPKPPKPVKATAPKPPGHPGPAGGTGHTEHPER